MWNDPERRPLISKISWILAAVGVAVLVGCGIWVGVRCVMAKDQLEAALPLAAKAQSALRTGDSSTAAPSIVELSDHARAAVNLTTDPLYRLGEVVPLIGPNLVALRRVSEVVSDVATSALTPLGSLAGSVSAASLKPIDGSIALAPLAAAAPVLTRAEATFARAGMIVAQIDTASTLPQVRDAVIRLGGALEQGSSAIATLSRAAQLIPAMLGNVEDRNYLLIFQNNAEVRASGGLPGALALLSTSRGKFTITAQSSATAFGRFAEPVLALDGATEALYGPDTARYLQSVGSTPDFPTTARLAAEMWHREFGTRVDGVIAMDPVLLSYVLATAQPVTLSTGDVINGSNTVPFLLSGVYNKYPNPALQDLIFADAARAVLTTLSSGELNTAEFVAALSRGSAERRLLIWNSRPTEQRVLDGTDFQGTLPKTNVGSSVIGVYLNDSTGAKLDYYLNAQVIGAHGVCLPDPATVYRTEVKLSSFVPSNPATALPAYVLGGIGTPNVRGIISTRIAIYGPVGSTVLSASVNGVATTVQSAQHFGRGVAQLTVDLAPGAIVSVSVDMAGAQSPAAIPSIRMTPLIRPTPIRVIPLVCN